MRYLILVLLLLSGCVGYPYYGDYSNNGCGYIRSSYDRYSVPIRVPEIRVPQEVYIIDRGY